MGFFSAVKRFFGQERPEKAPEKAKENIVSAAEQTNAPVEPASAAAESAAAEATPLAEPIAAEAAANLTAAENQAEEKPAEEILVAENASADLENKSEEVAAEILQHAESCSQSEPVGEAADSSEAFRDDAPGAPEPESAPGAPEISQIVEPGRPESATAEAQPEFIRGQPGGMPESGPVEAAEEEAVKPSAGERVETEAPPSAADNELLLRLRNAEPRLSAWLDIILEGQETANDQFWSRLRFLLRSLEAPDAEIERFLQDFAHWLERMEYDYVDEFRSELQYRLALALDLEDEEDERNRLLLKLEEGLAATRARIGRRLDELFSGHASLDDSFWEEMEELFITADMGYETSMEIVQRLKRRAADAGATEPGQMRQLLRDELEEIFRLAPRIRAVNKPEVILMMGVNGAGKTTTIAKLAYREKLNGRKALIVAADTFRAAAIEQLKVWADRAGAEFYQKETGADPAAVAWEGMEYALRNDIDTVFVDTAGRLQTRVNLMEELGKIRQVLAKKHPGSPHRNVLVLDATTGQNALSQAKLFKEAAGADEIILTKLDGTSKGGVAIAVAMRENLPITYIGLGEKMEDLRPFNGGDFAGALLDDTASAA